MLNVKKFTVNPFQENSYVVYTDKKNAVIIDPGFSDEQEEKQLVSFIESNKLAVEAIWLTHAHIDHIMGLHFCKNHFKIPIYMHTLEKGNLAMGADVAMRYGLPFKTFNDSVDMNFDDMTSIRLGAESFEILFTPGHSAGSVSFYHQASNNIFSGDVLFLQSIGRTDLPGGNHSTLEKTIVEKIYELPAETIVYSGHGAETSIGFERENNPFFSV